jgi:hypothetical protein
MFQKHDTFIVQYFIPCKRLYMFHPKHVEPFAGNKIVYQKSVILLEHFSNYFTMHGPISVKKKKNLMLQIRGLDLFNRKCLFQTSKEVCNIQINAHSQDQDKRFTSSHTYPAVPFSKYLDTSS